MSWRLSDEAIWLRIEARMFTDAAGLIVGVCEPCGMRMAGPPERRAELPSITLPESASCSDAFRAANFEMFTDEIDQRTMKSASSSVIMSA